MEATTEPYVIDSGVKAAETLMHIDEKLLNDLDPHSPPILHLYDWKGPSATFGYFTTPSHYLNVAAAASHGVALARRPTGGGIVFHLSDLAFSLLIPSGHRGYSTNTLDNYAFVNKIIIDAISTFDSTVQDASLAPKSSSCCGPPSFCMVAPTVYDVVINDKKVAGGAQRRTKKGYLHQGSIALSLPPRAILSDLLIDFEAVYAAMQANTYCLFGDDSPPESARAALKSCLVTALLRG